MKQKWRGRGRQFRQGGGLAILVFFSFSCASDEPSWEPTVAGTDTLMMAVSEPDRFWTKENGFVEMVSPIKRPSTLNAQSRIQEFLKLPSDGLIDVTFVDEPKRPLLLHPKGTRADRVESRFVYTHTGMQWTIADVRGGEIQAEGQGFHVLRPRRSGPGSALFGYGWQKGDHAANERAHDAIISAMKEFGAGFVYQPSPRQLPRRIDGFKGFSSCAQCHQLARPPRLRADEPSPFRGSDASGFFAVQTVLENVGPLELYRPHDVNHLSPYISIECSNAETAERQTSENGSVRFTCPDGIIPYARFDLAGALAAGDVHAEQVCRSRRYLYAHFTQRAQAAFSERFKECGI